MPEPENDTPGAPSEVWHQNTTGPLRALGLTGEGTHSWLRVVFGMILGALLVGNIFLYSLHQALHARVENQERRSDRLGKMVDDLLITNKNAEKIEKIEQQVDGISSQVQDLTDIIRAEPEKVEKPKRKRQRKKR